MKMRKKKQIKKFSRTTVLFAITPETIARVNKYLEDTRERFLKNLALGGEIEIGGVLAGPTK